MSVLLRCSSAYFKIAAFTSISDISVPLGTLNTSAESSDNFLGLANPLGSFSFLGSVVLDDAFSVGSVVFLDDAFLDFLEVSTGSVGSVVSSNSCVFTANFTQESQFFLRSFID